MLRLHVCLLPALLLAACGSNNLRPQDKSPPIASLGKKQPDRNKLAIVLSDPVAPDPDKALENYRAILELSPDDTVRQEAMRRMADLQVQADDAAGGSAETEKLLADSIGTYQQLLQESPGDARNDRVLYQLARAYQNSGQPEKAIETLTQITSQFPNSRFNGDAHFRRAELLFRLGNYPEAEGEYRYVMNLAGATPYFEPAQYKYGWSLFKQSRFDDALPVFFAILDRELPPGELNDVEAALKSVQKGKADLAKDSLRVTSLAFAIMGGGPAVNQYFASHTEPRFFPLIYNALGEMLLDKRRFTDAAGTFAAFIERHARHPSAPQFQARVIEVYSDGGFNDLVVREKERYVNTYSPGTAYWAGATPGPEVLKPLRTHLEDLAKHYQALAQQGKNVPQVDQAQVRTAFLSAADWYRRIITIYPEDPNLPEINYLLAESLEDGGKALEAANEFSKTAYGYNMHPRSLDAGYAAVLAYHSHADAQPAATRAPALKQAVEASIKLADNFPTHPQAVTALTRAAQDLYELKDAQAVTVAQRVLGYTPAPTAEQRRIVQGVLGDSYFAQGDFPRAEIAYSDLLKLTAPNSAQRSQVVEQLAASIYKQAEAARANGDLRTAADGFLRVGRVTPDAAIRQTADYDAGAALIGLSAWGEATAVLEAFRSRYPSSPLLTDVDKKLAVAYVKDNKPVQAAEAYRRIATRSSETAEVRQDAAWQAAKLFDDSKRLPDAVKAYEFYVGAFPMPLDRAIDARRRIADIYNSQGDGYRYLFWLRELVTADEAAGRNRTEHSKAIAAQSALDVGRITAQDAARIRLTAPVEVSLPQRKGAVEAAIQALEKAARYGYADIATAATYELGAVYQSFAKALMDSERPRKLSAEEVEQYNILLEEQALPFEDKAIAAHEGNLKRLGQGLYDESIARSVTALGTLSPAKYGKREVGGDSYDTLK
jgi:cellulose synthase operon protein C